MPPDLARCPRCRRAAPTIVRGLEAVCVVCGAARSPLASVPVNVAGQPAKVGGSIARVVGWIALGGGLAAALVVGALLQAIFPLGIAGWIVGGVIASLALALGLTLLIGGQRLHLAGAGRERAAALEAISALAHGKGGAVTVEDVARALRMPAARADELLTDLAKQGDRVRLEVDDAGQLLYYVDHAGPRLRVAPERPNARIGISPGEDASHEEEIEDHARQRGRHRA